MKNIFMKIQARHLRKISAILLYTLIISTACSQSMIKNPIVHDPVMIKQNDTYYLFCTGWGISVYSSTDMVSWKVEEAVFKKAPSWTFEKVNDFKGHIWAPDIYYKNGTYYLYYSVSSFAKNTSCIGLATNKTLDPSNPDFEWKDEGMILQSVPGRDMWNAIDPNIIEDKTGNSWMAFGSFWNGLKLVKLNNDLKSIANNPEIWHTISSRERSFNLQDTKPGDAAVEAPFIFKKADYFYLFVSFDYCCRGAESTYKLMVGRSKTVSGPYLDKEGTRMDFGGGTLLLEGNNKWSGLGHNSAYTFNNTDYLIYHAYDAKDDGKPKLQITEMTWDKDGWPILEIKN